MPAAPRTIGQVLESIRGEFPDISVNVFTLVATFLLISINFMNVRNYGEFEFWFALIKVTAIVCFIIICLLAVLNIWQGGTVHGIANLTAHGGFMPNGWSSVIVAMLGVMFAFLGAEIVTIAASESANPADQIVKATNSVVWRICLFYIGSIFLIVCLVPWNDPHLGESGYGSYRRTLELLGVPGAQYLMNFVVLTSVSSCLISAHYTASRMLFSLAKRGDAHPIFKQTSTRGIPVYSVIASCSIAVFIAMLNFFDSLRPKDILDLLMNTTGMIAMLVYLVIAFSQLKMRRKLEAEGREIRLKMWLFPWLTYGVIAFIIGSLIVMMFIEEYRHMVLATAVSRLRAKIKYRPVIFDLMPERFSLLQLQKSVEALVGCELHKQNFRRQVLHQGLLKPVDQSTATSRGRPARLYRFHESVLSESLISGGRLSFLKG